MAGRDAGVRFRWDFLRLSFAVQASAIHYARIKRLAPDVLAPDVFQPAWLLSPNNWVCLSFVAGCCRRQEHVVCWYCENVPMIDTRTIEEQPLISIEKLTMRFGTQTVLKNISLQIPAGQTLVVIGESGCGKSVLMKSIIGLVSPTRGSVRFDTMDMAKLGERALTKVRLRFGYVFQNAALFDSMTVGNNVAFPLRQHGGFSDSEITDLVLEKLNEVGLPPSVVVKRPMELSGGMRKRVAVARALIVNPEVLMYDEPTTGLDPVMSDVINEMILRTRRRIPVTSIVVTHDMHTARRVADRVVMLSPYSRLEAGESQIIFDGTPAELDTSDDRRVRQFVNGEAGERLMELAGDTHRDW